MSGFVLLIQFINAPAPAISTNFQDARIAATINKSYVIFPTEADCFEVLWDIRNIGTISLNGQTVSQKSQQRLCFPSLFASFTLTLGNGSQVFFTIKPTDIFAEDTMRLAIFAMLVSGVGLIYSLSPNRWNYLFSQYEWLMVGIVVSVFIVSTDLLTGYEQADYGSSYYINFAEKGFSDHAALRSPYVYRPVVPFISGAISKMLNIPTRTGFIVFAYISSISLLIIVYAISRFYGANRWQSLGLMGIVGVSQGILKTTLYFGMGLEATAQTLSLLFMIFYLRRNLIMCLLITLIGLLTREFFFIQCSLLFFWVARNALKQKTKESALELLIVFGLVSLTIIVPRLIFRNIPTEQYVDPLNSLDTLRNLIDVPLNMYRNVNLVVGTLAVLLPFIALYTPHRYRAIQSMLATHRNWIIIYTGALALLTMYGGTDLNRYLAYAIIPLLIPLIGLFTQKAQPISIVETVVLLTALALFNMLPFEVPNPNLNFNGYLDFWSPYQAFIGGGTLRLVLGFMAIVIIMRLIRAQTRPQHVPISVS